MIRQQKRKKVETISYNPPGGMIPFMAVPEMTSCLVVTAMILYMVAIMTIVSEVKMAMTSLLVVLALIVGGSGAVALSALAGVAALIGMFAYEDSFVRAGQSVPLS